MEYVVTAHEMKQIEEYTIHTIGIPSLILMERAAYSVYSEMIARFDHSDKFLILCGNGNNGADGLAIARMLHIDGYDVSVYMTNNNTRLNGHLEKATEELQVQYSICNKIGVPFITEIHNIYHVIIDGILGIGIKGTVREQEANIIHKINTFSAYVISIDIPSGVDGSTGMVMNAVIKADMTITFGFNKIGLCLYSGKKFAGEVLVKDIGFPSIIVEKFRLQAYIYTNKDLNKLPIRENNTHKGSFGRLLIIAGSFNMAGAAILSSRAAYRMGAGLVQILTDIENRIVIGQAVPEAILTTYSNYKLNPQRNSDFINEDICHIRQALKSADAIAIGMGLGMSNISLEIVKEVLQIKEIPVIIDADGLNLIASHNLLEEGCSYQNVIITPHILEMSRLAGVDVPSIKNIPIQTAQDFCRKYHLTCVLKDAVTIVTNDREHVFINTTGNNGMATAGSGDVLAGIISSLAVQGIDLWNCATLGVYIHGYGGNIAASKKGTYGMIASDIIDGILNIEKLR